MTEFYNDHILLQMESTQRDLSISHTANDTLCPPRTLHLTNVSMERQTDTQTHDLQASADMLCGHKQAIRHHNNMQTMFTRLIFGRVTVSVVGLTLESPLIGLALVVAATPAQ